MDVLPRKAIGNWYALAVNSGSERKIRERIFDRLEREKIDTKHLTIVCPEEEVVFTQANGQRKTKRRMAMPGYMLLHTRRADKRALATIGRVRGVLKFLGPDGDPTPLRLEEVDQILGSEDGSRSVASNPAFEAGDEVSVTAGPFSGFSGKVLEVSESKGTARIEIEIFGRATPAEVEFRALRKGR